MIGGQLPAALIGCATPAVTDSTAWSAAIAAGPALGAMMLRHLSHSPAVASAVVVVGST